MSDRTIDLAAYTGAERERLLVRGNARRAQQIRARLRSAGQLTPPRPDHGQHPSRPMLVQEVAR